MLASRIVKSFSKIGIYWESPVFEVAGKLIPSCDFILIQRSNKQNWIDRIPVFWTQVQIFLELGASPPSWSHLIKVHQDDTSSIRLTIGHRTYTLTEEGNGPFMWRRDFEPPCVREEGGVATLRDFLDYEEIPPWNAPQIKALLEKSPNEPKPRPITEFKEPAPTREGEIMSTSSTAVETETSRGGEGVAIRGSEAGKQGIIDSQQEMSLLEQNYNENSHLENFSFLRDVKEAISSPLLPWFLLGMSSMLLMSAMPLILRPFSFHLYCPCNTKALASGGVRAILEELANLIFGPSNLHFRCQLRFPSIEKCL